MAHFARYIYIKEINEKVFMYLLKQLTQSTGRVSWKQLFLILQSHNSYFTLENAWNSNNSTLGLQSIYYSHAKYSCFGPLFSKICITQCFKSRFCQLYQLNTIIVMSLTILRVTKIIQDFFTSFFNLFQPMSQRQIEHLVPIESMMGPSGGKVWVSSI